MKFVNSFSRHTKQSPIDRFLATSLALIGTVAFAAVFPSLSQAGGSIFEAGSFDLGAQTSGSGTGSFTTINFAQTYDATPLVFVLPTNQDATGQPTAVRIRNVTATGFDASQVQTENVSGAVAAMTGVTYFAIMPGTYQLPSGVTLDAGSIETNVVRPQGTDDGAPFISVNFEPTSTFGSQPAVQTFLQTTNNESVFGTAGQGARSAPFIGTVVADGPTNGSSISTTGFDVLIDDFQADADSGTVTANETIGYVALSNGSGTLTSGGSLIVEDLSSSAATIDFRSFLTPNSIPHTSTSIPFQDGTGGAADPFTGGTDPLVVASGATINGVDGFWPRQISDSNTAVNLLSQEDTLGDSEVGHANERHSIFAFSEGFTAAATAGVDVHFDDGSVDTSGAVDGAAGDDLWSNNINWRVNSTAGTQNTVPNNVLPTVTDRVTVTLNNGENVDQPVRISTGDDFEISTLRIGGNYGLGTGGDGVLIVEDGGVLTVSGTGLGNGNIEFGANNRDGELDINSGGQVLVTNGNVIMGLTSSNGSVDNNEISVNGAGSLLDVSGNLVAGNVAGSLAFVTVDNGGTINVDGATIVGNSGSGTFTLTDGTLTTDQIVVGQNSGGTGLFTFTDGSITVVNTLANEAVMIGGVTNAASGGDGTFVMGDGTTTPTLNYSGGRFEVGAANGTTANFTLESGTITGGGNFIIGQGSNTSVSNATVNGGLLDVNADLNMNDGASTLTITGGEVNVSGTLNQMAGTGGSSSSTITISGTGRLVAGSIVDRAGDSTINLEGGDLSTLTTTNISVDDLNINSADGGGAVTYNRTGGALTVNNNLRLGGETPGDGNQKGNLTQTGGTVSVGGDLVFGGAANREGGTYNLNGGSLSVSGDIVETASNVDAAQLLLNGGTLLMPNGATTSSILVQRFSVGEATGTNVSYTANAPITTTGTLAVGGFGTAIGDMTIDDGTFPVNATNAVLGQGNTASGTLTVEGTGVFNVTGGDFHIAGDNTGGADSGTMGAFILNAGGTATVTGGNTEVGTGGTGTYTQNGGSFTQLSNNFVIAQDAASSGLATINGGLFETSTGQIRVGNSSGGQLDITGGIVNTAATVDLANVNNATSDGEINISGGQLNVGAVNTAGVDDLLIGNLSDGRLNVSGTGLVTVDDNLVVSNSGTATGAVTQTGGTVDVGGNVLLNVNGPGTYSLTGGELTGGDTSGGAFGTRTQVNNGEDTILQIDYNAVSTETFTFGGLPGGTLSNITTIDPNGTSDNTFTQDGGRFVIGVDGGLDTDNAVRATTNIGSDYVTTAGSTLAVDIFGNDLAGGDYYPGSLAGEGSIVSDLLLDVDDIINSPTASDLLIVGNPDGTNLGLADLTAGLTLDIATNGIEQPFLGYFDVLLADTILIDPETFAINGGPGIYRIVDLVGGGQVLQVATPEPATILIWTLIGAALFGGATWRRRRNKAAA